MERTEIKREIEEYITTWDLVENYSGAKEKGHLFGSEMKMDPRNLMYLLTHLEEKYQVLFGQQDVMGKNIFTVEKLTNTVVQKLGA